MDSLLVVSLVVVTLEELIQSIDAHGVVPHELVTHLPKDRTLVPALVAALQKFVEDANFYGRDVICQALSDIEDIEALPHLLRASAVDLGDDQDTLTAMIVDLLDADHRRAVEILDLLDRDASSHLRDVLIWARTFVEDSSGEPR